MVDAFLVAMEIIPRVRDVLEESDGIYPRVITLRFQKKTKALLTVSGYTWSSLPLYIAVNWATAWKNWSPSEDTHNATVSPSLYIPYVKDADLSNHTKLTG